MNEPLIRIVDVVYPIFSAPDLRKMRSFLEDFGMVLAYEGSDELFMRGSGATPVVHKTVRGAPNFTGLAVQVASKLDLDKLAAVFGTSVEPNTGPGGGEMVVGFDPDGRRIEALYGFKQADALAHPDRVPDNVAHSRARLGLVKRFSQGSARIMRFGHAALKSSDLSGTVAWYQRTFGLLESDSFFVGDETGIAGVFMRCDRGIEHTDHHTILIQASSAPGLGHCGWEVFDVDDLMLGHDHLRARGHSSYWGVGRHVLGSQVFDYWKDPWGNVVEHWTDGDLLDAEAQAGRHPIETILGQWGPMPPADF